MFFRKRKKPSRNLSHFFTLENELTFQKGITFWKWKSISKNILKMNARFLIFFLEINIGMSECKTNNVDNYNGRNFKSHVALAERLSTVSSPFMVTNNFATYFSRSTLRENIGNLKVQEWKEKDWMRGLFGVSQENLGIPVFLFHIDCYTSNFFIKSVRSFFKLPLLLYNAILRIARNFLETRENIKISTYPFYHINLGWFSKKKNSKWPTQKKLIF